MRDVGDSGGGDEEENLSAVVLVADGNKIHIVNRCGEDEPGGRRKGTQYVLKELIGVECKPHLHNADEMAPGLGKGSCRLQT
jgi:hypothetical protein